MIQTFGTLELNYRPQTDLTRTSLTGAYRVDADTMINGTHSGYTAGPSCADLGSSARIPRRSSGTRQFTQIAVPQISAPITRPS
jgi:hypothetical protein